MTALLGIQIPAPERAADPPKVGAFSSTTVLRPCLAAASAAVIPAAPEPMTTTSYVPTVGKSAALAPCCTPAATAAAPAPAASRCLRVTLMVGSPLRLVWTKGPERRAGVLRCQEVWRTARASHQVGAGTGPQLRIREQGGSRATTVVRHWGIRTWRCPRRRKQHTSTERGAPP